MTYKPTEPDDLAVALELMDTRWEGYGTAKKIIREHCQAKRRPFTIEGTDMCPHNWQKVIANAVEAIARIKSLTQDNPPPSAEKKEGV